MSVWSLRWHFTNKSVTGTPYSNKGYSYSLSHSRTLWWRVRWLKQLRHEVAAGSRREEQISRILLDCRVTQATLWHVKTSCKITIWPICKDLVYSVSSQKIQWGWASAIWQLDSLFDTVRIVWGAGSIKRSGVRPSVSLSHQSNAAAACGGFAAERRTRKRYRSTAPGARQQQRRSPGLQHGAQQQMRRPMSCWQPSWRD